MVVVGALGIAVLSNGNATEKADLASQVSPVSVTGQPLPTFAGAGSADAAVGTQVPTLSGTGMDGNPIAIEDDGKAKVLLFAAHWCPHCQKEIPLLAPDLRANPLPANTEMYTVSTSVNASAPNYPPSEWFENEEWPTPVIEDDENNTAAEAFGLDGFPYFVFVNADSTVSARASGELTIEQFRAYVNALQ